VADDKHTINPVLKDSSVTKKEFKDHLRYFHHFGLAVVSIDSAIKLLESGEAEKGRCVSHF
jgi:hypothetical protein